MVIQSSSKLGKGIWTFLLHWMQVHPGCEHKFGQWSSLQIRSTARRQLRTQQTAFIYNIPSSWNSQFSLPEGTGLGSTPHYHRWKWLGEFCSLKILTQQKFNDLLYSITLIPARVLGLPQSIETDKKPVKKFRQGFIGDSTAAGGSENKNIFLFLTPWWGQAGSLCVSKDQVIRVA